eukprot:gene34299-22282_t
MAGAEVAPGPPPGSTAQLSQLRRPAPPPRPRRVSSHRQGATEDGDLPALTSKPSVADLVVALRTPH